MALFIKKFGGSSLANQHALQVAAQKIIADYQQGHQVVVVVSATYGETDRLINLAKSLTNTPDPREYAVLLATGEQVAAALLTICLQQLGVVAQSFTGLQAGIITTGSYTNATIKMIQTQALQTALAANTVPIVTGFQGMDEKGHMTVLHRGGSDITAAALAAVLNADECQVYTDVEGVYTADPHVVHIARCKHALSYQEMLCLAQQGAKVLQWRSVELAANHQVPLRVLPHFNDKKGTFIMDDKPLVENKSVVAITHCVSFAQIILQGLASETDIAELLLQALIHANINFDQILHLTLNTDKTDLMIIVDQQDYTVALARLMSLKSQHKVIDIVGREQLAKISLIGHGIGHNGHIIQQLYRILCSEGIIAQFINTSITSLSILVHEQHLQATLYALHHGFNLE